MLGNQSEQFLIMKNLIVRFHGPSASPRTTVREEPLTESPAPCEVLIEMIAAAINPADLNVLEGTYGRPLEPGGIPGNEGFGTVTACGPGVTRIAPGDGVIVAGQAWRRSGIWREDSVFPVGEHGDPLQLAMLRINPATAWCLLKEVAPPQPGAWVIQNAANSGVGRWISALANHWNIPLVSLARRLDFDNPSPKELRFVDKPESVRSIRAAVGDHLVTLALNAVGGDSSSRLARVLTPNATHVTYGAMSRQPVTVGNGSLIFSNLTVRGFWVSRWLEETRRERVMALYRELADLTRRGVGSVPVAATYPLERLEEALAHAARAERGGKVLLTLS